MSKLPEIIFGTYEAFLIGYKIERDNGGFKFSLDMASHAHLGSIRDVAVNKNLLASAGADEYVNVFDMANRKELAVLTPHEGTVTSILFVPDGSHLISGSQDGNISIFRCSDWKLMKAWKGAHKKPNGVVSMAVHPSGKLLLSIGADHIMRVWNMVKGRQAYAVNFGKKITPGNTLNLVSWSHDGSHYAITIGNTCEVYETKTASVSYCIKCDSRITCFDFSIPDIICIGREDGIAEVHNYNTKETVINQCAHESRIKCLQIIPSTSSERYLVTADSKGLVRFWRWKTNRQTQGLKQEAEVDADCRIVCMSLLNVESEDNESRVHDVTANSTISVDISSESPKKKSHKEHNSQLGKSAEKKQRKCTSPTKKRSAGPIGKNNMEKQAAVQEQPLKSKKICLSTSAWCVT